MNDLHELGYISKYFQLNASDFGLPQNRPRLLMISVYVGENDELNELMLQYFKRINEQKVINDYRSSEYFRDCSVADLLRLDYTDPVLLEEARECTPNDTVSRRKIWDDNPQLVLPGNTVNTRYPVIRTITTKQDRNPNSGNLYFKSGLEGRASFRYLTPRECMLFMGFTDADYELLRKNNIEFHKGDSLFARDKIIRLAGNSIPVKLLEGVFLQVLKIDQILKDYRCLHIQNVDSIKEYYAKKIRSCMFEHGIRSRLSKGPYPAYADVLYPCHHTAVFICDCFWHGHECPYYRLPQHNLQFWKELIDLNVEKVNEGVKMAEEMGWKAVVLWTCELSNDRFSATIERLVSVIKEPETIIEAG